MTSERHGSPKRYAFGLLKNSILPMSLSLKYLVQYKVKKEKTMAISIVLASDADTEKSYFYSGNYKELEPTVTMLMLNV